LTHSHGEMEEFEVEIVDEIRKSIADDLNNFYRKVFRGRGKDDFYWYIVSANPKLFPISGTQHYLGAGFIGLRLGYFLGFNEYKLIVAFLGGLFHDFNKWYKTVDEMKKNVFERFEVTRLYNIITDILGDKKAENAFYDAIEIGLKLESGGMPRILQKVSEVVRLGDILTGDRACWSLTVCIDRIMSSFSNISIENIFPVFIGKQRPLIPLISEVVERELESQGGIPLLSTPEGMLFLTKERIIDVENIYKKIAEYVSSSIELSEEKEGKGRIIKLGPIKEVLDGRRKLATTSGVYRSIAGYSLKDIDATFEYTRMRGALEDLRLLIVVLANIYRKDPNKREKEEERLKRFVMELQALIPDVKIDVTKIEVALRKLYERLKELDRDSLLRLAERGSNFIKNEMIRYRTIEPSLLIEKIATYINIGYQKKKLLEKPGRGSTCSICRDTVILEKSLTSFLQELKKNVIRRINISELFHSDLQGKPEKIGSIEQVKKLPVCETCYFEVIVAPKHIGYMDGLWAYVLTYYPVIPIDLLKTLRYTAEEITGITREKFPALTDYMTSRLIVSAGSKLLLQAHLRTALDLWYVLGGNLVLTTTALGAAFTWSGLPIEMDITDVIVEEMITEYMEVLRKAKKRSSYLNFTTNMRYWLYKTLRDYVSKLEPKRGALRTTDVRFSRSGLKTSGYATVDTYSFILKQLQKGVRS